MDKIHIRNIFRIFVPLDKSVGSAPRIRTDPFGVDFPDEQQQFSLNIRLVRTDVFGNIKDAPKNCFTWAKLNSVMCQDNASGLFIRLKINQGVFDFRKTKDRLFQIIVELIEHGAVTQAATSTIWELFPKKRHAENDKYDNEGKKGIIKTRQNQNLLSKYINFAHSSELNQNTICSCCFCLLARRRRLSHR